MTKGADPRFSSMLTAPTFKKAKKENFKVKVDDRFKTILNEKKFQSVPGEVDLYGRKVSSKTKDRVAKEMKEFYDIDEAETDSKKTGSSKPQSADNRLEYLSKLARGEISGDSSSSEDEDEENSNDEEISDNENKSEGDSSNSSEDEDEVSDKPATRSESALHIPGQLEQELSADVESNRIAIRNCDWENVSAEDLMYVSILYKIGIYLSNI